MRRRFSVPLPPPEVSIPQSLAAAKPLIPARPAILIVEDELILAKDLQRTLIDFGYDAFAIASSAEAAVSRANERCPDLVMMDIRIKGIAIKELYDFAATLDVGKDEDGALGIGIYPTSQFIHVDFRAPGEPSYRWTDWSGHSSGKSKPSKSRPPSHNKLVPKPVS